MKTTIVILNTGIIAGVPAEPFAIPGFTCIFQKEGFAKARNESIQTDHFICDQGDSWALWPIKYDGQKTEKNPLGEYVAPGQPIRIKKL